MGNYCSGCQDGTEKNAEVNIKFKQRSKMSDKFLRSNGYKKYSQEVITSITHEEDLKKKIKEQIDDNVLQKLFILASNF